MLLGVPELFDNTIQLLSNLFSNWTVYYLLTKNLISFLFDCDFVWRIAAHVIVENVEEDAVVAFFVGVVSKDIQKTVALTSSCSHNSFVGPVKSTNQTILKLSKLSTNQQRLYGSSHEDD